VTGLDLETEDESTATGTVNHVWELLLKLAQTSDDELGCSGYLVEGFGGGEAFKDVVS
jgi:hypothetical protein